MRMDEKKCYLDKLFFFGDVCRYYFLPLILNRLWLVNSEEILRLETVGELILVTGYTLMQ